MKKERPNHNERVGKKYGEIDQVEVRKQVRGKEKEAGSEQKITRKVQRKRPGQSKDQMRGKEKSLGL